MSFKSVHVSSPIPCGLVVRIRRFHRRGRGSIPRMGDDFFEKCKKNPFALPSLEISMLVGETTVSEASVVQW